MNKVTIALCIGYAFLLGISVGETLALRKIIVITDKVREDMRKLRSEKIEKN